MKRLSCALLLAVLGLSGCTTFHGLTPIHPETGHPMYPAVVDSTRPTLRWQPASEPDLSYDLIIYEVIVKRYPWWSFGGPGGRRETRTPGRVVYYRQGLKDSVHTVDEPLNAGTEYYWSVRVRRGEKVSRWSTYDYTDGRWTNLLFLFKTPDK